MKLIRLKFFKGEVFDVWTFSLSSMSITLETGTVCGHVFMRFPQDNGFTEIDNNFLFYTMRRFLDDFKQLIVWKWNAETQFWFGLWT